MKSYKLYNKLTGWIIWAIASAVYLLTMEPTVSLWDCGEFIASAYKLEIGHPPGAPFFMLLGNFFSNFAFGDTSKVAFFVNSLSALASSFTILFLFWTITHIAEKILIKNDGEYRTGNIIAVLGAGAVGALAYTFSDSFWFSAVEGEVYATSSFFTAIVFWAMLKWENEADKKGSERWIILIAYLMGLSIGVHLLNLLTIPAIALIYYFKKYKATKKGVFYALLVGGLILSIVQFVIIPGTVKVAGLFELFAVNVIGMPYNAGIFIYFALIAGLLVFGIHYTHKHKKKIANLIILSVTVIMIGYSCFSIIMIRSLANPPMDENNPENFFSLLSYINREQYGDRPLLYGPYFNVANVYPEEFGEGNPFYVPKDGKYVVAYRKPEYKYDKAFYSIFPRMHSHRGDHVKAYKNVFENGQYPHRKVKAMGRNGKQRIEKVPTFGANMQFFFKYQLNHMYWRYFMWNFAGRQNDEQGFYGDPLHGNWISGIKFIDEMRLGSQDLPESMKDNESRNTYYLLPLILGLIGLFYHAKKHPNGFTTVFFLFFLTGIAIIIYLNQPPFEPRERDYTFVGSFYAFAIWIGLGVMGIFNKLREKLPGTASAAIATSISLLAVPTLMAAENWEDHDRSNRYTAKAHAYNYLNSCAPNAILFTNGDNDTFPLWYLQEVEGVRTDVRVVNLMLLNTDWHILQAMRKAYDSERLPISMPEDKYTDGTNNSIELIERVKKPLEIKKVIDFVKSDNIITKKGEAGRGHDFGDKNKNIKNPVDYIPTKEFILPVDSAKIFIQNVLPLEDTRRITGDIQWRINKRFLSKSQLCMMDMIATGNWERPIYYVSPGNDNTLGLNEYLQLEGYAYRQVPVKTPKGQGFMDAGKINTDTLYNNLMNKFIWGNMDKEETWLGHFDLRTIQVVGIKNKFHRLADALISEGDTTRSIEVLDRCMEVTPKENIPWSGDYNMVDIIRDYYRAGEIEKANEISIEMAKISGDEMKYLIELRQELNSPKLAEREINTSRYILSNILRISKQYEQHEVASEVETMVGGFMN